MTRRTPFMRMFASVIGGPKFLLMLGPARVRALVTVD